MATLLLLFSEVALPAPDFAADATLGASSDYRYSNRLSIELYRTRLLAIDVRDASPEALPGVPVYQAFGLASPLFLAGPVEQQGLHRVVGNPLGYSASSSALTEATRLRLDGSFSPASREALSLRFWEQRLQLSGIRSRAGYSTGSLYAAPFRGPRLRTELFAMVTETDAQGLEGSEEDSWFAEKRPRPGGPLTLASATFEINGRDSGFKSFLGGSLSEGLPPGGYLLLRYVYAREVVEAVALAGRQGGYYAEPDGDYGTSKDRLGAVVRLPGEPAELELGHHYRRSHPAIDGSSLGARENETEAEATLVLFDRPGTGLRLEAEGRWEGRAIRDRDAGGRSTVERQREVVLGGSAVVSGALESVLGAEYSRRYVGPARRRLELSGNAAAGRAAFGGSVDWVSEEGPFVPTVELEAEWKWDRGQLRLEGSYTWPEPGREGEPKRPLEIWFVEIWFVQEIRL